jgi:hypothetical protein
MIAPTSRVIALLPLPSAGEVGGPPPGEGARSAPTIFPLLPFASSTILIHTLRRLARCKTLDRIVLLKERADPTPQIPADLEPRVAIHEIDGPLFDAHHQTRLAARRWSPTAWRGGLAGMTLYDEYLCAGPMSAALEAHDASAGLIVGADWPLVDPALCDAVVERHLTQPQTLKLVFTQAPPGLAGCLVDRSLLGELRDTAATLGSLLEYTPRLPQGDPIGKDPCVQIAPEVRNYPGRITFGSSRDQAALRHIESARNLPTLDAAAVVRLLGSVPLPASPQQVTLEITTTRSTYGPLTPLPPGEGGRFLRPGEGGVSVISVESAARLFQSLPPDTALTLAGLGDPLLHPDFESIVLAARAAGLPAIHVQTDLLVDTPMLQKLLDLPIDIVSVNLNADTAPTYERLMGVDGHGRVIQNIEWLLNHRRNRARPGLPWIVPRFIKVAENVHELENFFDRWVYYCGHAVVESPTPGDETLLVPPVINMAPPRRVPCRQLAHRMTIHCDSRAALCDQDRRGRHAVGDTATRPLSELWQKLQALRAEKHAATPLCAACHEWHRP